MVEPNKYAEQERIRKDMAMVPDDTDLFGGESEPDDEDDDDVPDDQDTGEYGVDKSWPQ